MKSRRFFLALLLSGAGVLFLEIVWTRQAVLLFGSTTKAQAVVLAVFMAGLALGDLLAGWLLPRIGRPFLLYAGLEGGTAAVSLALAAFVHSWGTTRAIPAGWGVLFLLVPATAMGMTLPLVLAGLDALGVGRRKAASLGYGINTLGAAAGTLVGGFWAIPAVGLHRTAGAGALFLILAALLAGVRSGGVRAGKRVSERTEPTPRAWGNLGLAAWAGAGALTMEILWTRLLSLVLGPSVYALSLILFVFLLGISLGAALFTRGWARRLGPGVLFLLLGLALSAGLLSFGFLPYLFLEIAERLRPSPVGLRGVEFFLCLLPILPAAILHGMILPALMDRHPASDVGRGAAWVLAANTIGGIVGALATGLFLIPRAGFLPLLVAVATLHLGVGVVLHLQKGGGRPPLERFARVGVFFLGGIALLAGGASVWDRAVLAAGVYKYAVGNALGGKEGRIQIGNILYFREGISSTVAVIESKDDRILSIDGKADASLYGDRSTQVLLGALPLSLSAGKESVLVVGFASGVTAGVASLFPGTRVTSVDIEPAVYEASNFFRTANHGPLDPRLHPQVVGDGRRFLAQRSERFDVITSEPSNPWMSGVSPLFTREFFRLASSRLAPGGVMCQWLPIYGMTSDLVGSVLATFASVFPSVLVFESVEGYDLLLIGSMEPKTLDVVAMEKSWRGPELRRELSAIGIQSGVDLAGHFLMGGEGLRVFSGNVPVNTDDNGYLEFRAPLALHLRTAETNHAALVEASEGVRGYLEPSTPMRVRKKLKEYLQRRGDSRLAEGLE